MSGKYLPKPTMQTYSISLISHLLCRKQLKEEIADLDKRELELTARIQEIEVEIEKKQCRQEIQLLDAILSVVEPAIDALLEF